MSVIGSISWVTAAQGNMYAICDNKWQLFASSYIIFEVLKCCFLGIIFLIIIEISESFVIVVALTLAKLTSSSAKNTKPTPRPQNGRKDYVSSWKIGFSRTSNTEAFKVWIAWCELRLAGYIEIEAKLPRHGFIIRLNITLHSACSHSTHDWWPTG